MLGWEFPPEINGGLGVACLGLAKALASRKVSLEVIVPRTRSSEDLFQLTGLSDKVRQEPGLTREAASNYRYQSYARVQEVPVGLSPYDHLTVREQVSLTLRDWSEFASDVETESDLLANGHLYGETLGLKVMAYSKLAAQLAMSREFDVIHAHDWMTFLAGVEIKKATGKPLVVHVHSTEFDRAGGIKKNWIYDLERYGVSEADAVIPVSYYTGEILKYHYGVYPEKIFPVHNGIDPHPEKVSKKRNLENPVILFVGRLTSQKGPRYFLEAAKIVSEVNQAARFTFVGIGDEQDSLADYAGTLGIGERVSFAGFVPHDEVREYYKNAAVYCMPSVSDPFGLTALEAAQCQLPGVISKQAGVTEVLKGALTADYWDAETIAKHILAFLSKSKLRKRVLKQAKKDMKKLTWKHAARRVSRIYDQVTASGKVT